MTVYVLAGGLGTRIAGLFPDRPKALVPVAGRPWLDRVLEGLAAKGLTDVVVCAGVGGEAVRDHVGDGSACGVRATTVIEPSPLGTAGAIAFARRAGSGSGDGTFLTANGDTWAEFDTDALVGLHRRLGAVATLACYEVADAAAKGTVDPGDDGTLRGFREKSHAGPGWVSGGVYVLEPEALDGVRDDAPSSLERDVFPQLLAAGRTLGAWKAPGRFWDMGTPEGRAETEAHYVALDREGR